MREIKFRGFSYRLEELVIGSLVIDEDAFFIYNPNPGMVRTEIDPNTIGQYTGLKDKNDREIYEGDIVYRINWTFPPRFVFGYPGEKGPATGENKFSYLLSDNINNPIKGAIFNSWNGDEVEVIGNIYETPELLEK